MRNPPKYLNSPKPRSSTRAGNSRHSTQGPARLPRAMGCAWSPKAIWMWWRWFSWVLRQCRCHMRNGLHAGSMFKSCSLASPMPWSSSFDGVWRGTWRAARLRRWMRALPPATGCALHRDSGVPAQPGTTSTASSAGRPPRPSRHVGRCRAAASRFLSRSASEGCDLGQTRGPRPHVSQQRAAAVVTLLPDGATSKAP